MFSHTERLTPEEFQILEQEKIPVRYSPSSTSSGTSLRLCYKNSTNFVTFDLPECLESVALIEYLGYTRAKADEIFARWSARPDPDSTPNSLVDYTLSELKNLDQPPLEEYLDRPAEAMRRLGISEDTITRITDPKHKDMLEMEPLAIWLERGMQSRFGTVMRYLDILKRKSRKLLG
ncbi:hypothetical protein EAE99_003226 [Botrytis elliptica]|nr:hypothetical protein EAE99_003226 [Botrytis elliptica]